MITRYAENVCMAAPGLAIKATTSAIVKYANTFSFKANGRYSGSITTADCPSLALATEQQPYPSGTAAVAGNLADGYYRIYTLVGTLAVTGTSGVTATFSWIASSDVLSSGDLYNIGNVAFPDKANQAAIGFVIVKNASGADFIPNSTKLDASNITTTYIDHYGFIMR